MKNLIVVDIDNTIHESDITMNRVSMELFNSPFRWCKQNEWYKGGHQHMPLENALKVFDRMHDRDMIFLTQPYVGSPEALQSLHNAGWEIAYYTDRKQSAHDATRDWLSEYEFPTPDNLRCCKDKRAALADIKDEILTVIDDRPRTMIYSLYELGVERVYSLRHPYNQNMSDIPGISLHDTWLDIHKAFVEDNT